LGTINGHRSNAPSEIRPCPQPPTPTAAPTKSCIRATSEFSRVFQQTAEPSSLSVLSVFQETPNKASGESFSMPELTPPSKDRKHSSSMRGGGDYPSDPDEMYKVLTWQGEQLVKLREQVNQLLSNSSQNSSFQSNGSQRQNSSVLADSSTQTSLPSTPVKKPPSELWHHAAAATCQTSPPHVKQVLTEDVSYIQINELAPSVDIDCSQGRVVEERLLQEREQIEVVPLEHKNVICRDLAPPEDIDKIISDHEKKTRGMREAPEPSMIGRLRNMGISFIKPSDLNTQERRTTGSAEAMSIWHPRATEPSLLSTTESTSEFSLMLNSAALKYLSDEQLAHVAMRNSGASVAGPVAVGAASSDGDVSRHGGLPDEDLSFAAKRYLNQNHY